MSDISNIYNITALFSFFYANMRVTISILEHSRISWEYLYLFLPGMYSSFACIYLCLYYSKPLVFMILLLLSCLVHALTQHIWWRENYSPHLKIVILLHFLTLQISYASCPDCLSYFLAFLPCTSSTCQVIWS